MTRLDTFILRMEAQRACLDWAIAELRPLQGAALELGLGNGRTYHHMRERLKGTREIYVFDRYMGAHPDSVPDAAYLILGEFRDTLPPFAQRMAGRFALIHADTGSGDRKASIEQARWLAGHLGTLLAPGGIVLSDQDMSPDATLGWQKLPGPPGLDPGRYHVYRKSA